jgi:hypothetical protein
MLFDQRLDGIDDADGEISQRMGLVNLAAPEWFASFREGRAPDRGFRHPR